jgi:hypothetical protein
MFPESDLATPYPRTTDMAGMARRCFPETLGFYRYWDSKRLNEDGKRSTW